MSGNTLLRTLSPLACRKRQKQGQPLQRFRFQTLFNTSVDNFPLLFRYFTHSYGFHCPPILLAEDADGLLQCILTLLHVRYLFLTVPFLLLLDPRTLNEVPTKLKRNYPAIMSQIVDKNSQRRELRRRTWLIQLFAPGPASLFSSWWMATMAFFLKPVKAKKEKGQVLSTKRLLSSFHSVLCTPGCTSTWGAWSKTSRSGGSRHLTCHVPHVPIGDASTQLESCRQHFSVSNSSIKKQKQKRRQL